MNQIFQKRGHPAGGLISLLLLLSGLLVAGAIRKIADATSSSLWDWIPIIGWCALFVSTLLIFINRARLRWRIETRDFEIILHRGASELFRGQLNQLELVDYDMGMLKLRTVSGSTFSFPAFGPLESLLTPDFAAKPY